MPCLKGINKLSMCELASIASASALLLSQGKCEEELETLGNLVASIGSLIMTFASTACPCENSKCDNEIANEIYNNIDTSARHIVSQQQIDNAFIKGHDHKK